MEDKAGTSESRRLWKFYSQDNGMFSKIMMCLMYAQGGLCTLCGTGGDVQITISFSPIIPSPTLTPVRTVEEASDISRVSRCAEGRDKHSEAERRQENHTFKEAETVFDSTQKPLRCENSAPRVE